MELWSQRNVICSRDIGDCGYAGQSGVNYHRYKYKPKGNNIIFHQNQSRVKGFTCKSRAISTNRRGIIQTSGYVYFSIWGLGYHPPFAAALAASASRLRWRYLSFALLISEEVFWLLLACCSLACASASSSALRLAAASI